MKLVGEASEKEVLRLKSLFGDLNVVELNIEQCAGVNEWPSAAGQNIVSVDLHQFGLNEVASTINFKELTRYDWLLEA